MSHLPFTRNHFAKGYPSIFPAMRIVRLQVFGGQHQIRFPGRYQQTRCYSCKECLIFILFSRRTTQTFFFVFFSSIFFSFSTKICLPLECNYACQIGVGSARFRIYFLFKNEKKIRTAEFLLNRCIVSLCFFLFK